MTEAVSGSASVTTTYGYDAANNRTSKVLTGGTAAGTTSYTYNALNQLTQYSEGGRNVALTYDANGNRATRVVTGGTDAGSDSYSYDYENRLIGLTKGTGTGSGTYAYAYDYRTRRVVRDESNAGGVQTTVVFSGGVSVQEYVNSSTYPAVEYVRGSDYGGGVGGILYTLRGAEASFTHENRRGDVIAKTNGSGVLTYQASYEAFGTRTQEQGSTQDRQKANTKEEDPTGLLNEGFRYRDLETGVFITKDPLGDVDGPNLYTYVKQNPWTAFDPEGLASLFEALAPATYSTVARSSYGSQAAAIQHSQTVTQPILRTIAATGYAVAAGPAVVATAAQAAPSGAAIFNAATAASHNPAAQAAAVAVISGAAAYNETGSVKAAVTTAALTLADGYSQGAFNRGGGPGNSASQTKAQSEQVVKEITIDQAKYPESVKHLEDAGALNTPLTVDRSGAAARRAEALKGVATKPGQDRDEAPPAVFKEGSQSVRHIPSSDNRGSGASMGQQLRGVQNNQKVILRKSEKSGDN